MSLVTEANGSGLFGGIYDKDGADYSAPDISDNEPSEAPDTTSAQTTAVTTAQTTPETTVQTTPVPETTPAETQAEAPAVTNGTIALPDYIQYYFDNDFADVWGITASIIPDIMPATKRMVLISTIAEKTLFKTTRS